MNIVLAPIAIAVVILGVIAIPFLIGVVLYNVARLAFLIVARVLRLAGGILLEAVRIVGHALVFVLNVPLILANTLFLRWDKLGDQGRTAMSEVRGAAVATYRIALVHPLRFIGLGRLVERTAPGMPAVAADELDFAPDGVAASSSSPSDFEGYHLIGTLPRGGSGARLYVAEPKGTKAVQLAKQAGKPVERVVIKAFSLEDGSTMPQIVRESRALEAARDLGLVFEHQLEATRFHYVMPYVPGDDLATVTRDLHQRAGAEGLDAGGLRAALNYFGELLITLERFHRKGLWHKDIKPSNVIVSRGRIHLVDLGLVTPLRSAMTLTTHGTEYFRDPEMVRLAMQGVKVHEVDGVKFDLYSAGALLYSMLENSFPAHGSLSRFSRRVPDALKWVVRRAMADMDKRYGGAVEMLADLDAVLASDNPFEIKPGELPSMQGRRMNFRGWEAGAEAAAFRTHGFEDNLSERMRLIGERMQGAGERVQGAGERVRGRIHHLSRRAERKLQRQASRLEAKAARRAEKPRRRGGLAVAATLLLLLGFAGMVALMGVRTVGMDSYASPVYSTVSHYDDSASEWTYEVYDDRGQVVLVKASYPLDIPIQFDFDHPPAGVTVVRSSGGFPGSYPGEASVAISKRASAAPIVPDQASLVTWYPEFAQPENLAPLESLEDRDQVLLLNDLPQDFDHESVDYLIEALAEMDLDVIGVGDSALDIEAIARARQVIGVSGPQDLSALDRLQAFLLSAEEFDAVLWLGRGEGEEDIISRVITVN